jgi:FSR family fosmidomycin resistance protein-like MFS transporter
MIASSRELRQRVRRASRLLPATLFSAELLDELTTGLPVVALPLLRDRLHLSYAEAGLLFTAGALASMLLEPLINLLADRGSKRAPVLLGMLGLAAALALAGLAPTYAVEVAAFLLLFPSSGAAVGLAQAALIDLAPEAAVRTMTRWTLLGSVGDLLAPLTTAALTGLGFGWSALCLASAALWLALLLTALPQRFPGAMAAATAENEPVSGGGLGPTLRDALRDRVLLRWAGVVLLCSMLDEVFLGFAALYLRDHLHATPQSVSLALLMGMAGALLGLAALERLLARVRGERLLPWLALATLAGIALFLAAGTLWQATLALFWLELTVAGWYPIAKAAAYGRQPRRTGAVLAVIGLGAPFEMLLPGVVGIVASRFGLTAGLALLGLAPLGVLLLAPRAPAPATRG